MSGVTLRVLSEVAKVQWAHSEPRSLSSAPGARKCSTSQDLPSTGTLPPGLALCAAPPVTL